MYLLKYCVSYRHTSNINADPMAVWSLKALEKLKRQLAEAEAELEARKKPSEDTGPKFIGEGLVIDEWVSHLNLESLVARCRLYHFCLVYILFPHELCAEGKKRKILGSSTSGRGRFHMTGVFLLLRASFSSSWKYGLMMGVFSYASTDIHSVQVWVWDDGHYLSIWVVSSFLWWLLVLIIGLSSYAHVDM